MKYYFLVGYLPDLQREDRKLKIGLSELIGGDYEIHPEDMADIRLILLGRDVFMVEKLLEGRAVSLPDAVYGLDFWQDQVRSPQEGPGFLLVFLKERKPGKPTPQEVNRLYGAYYEHAVSQANTPFLKRYFQFEKDLRNILAALRSRRKNGDMMDQLVGEDALTMSLAGSSLEDFGLSEDYPWIGELIATDYPPRRQDLMEKIVWDFLDEQTGNDPFHFNAILSYVIKLSILEKKLSLRQDKGMDIVRRLEEG